MTGRTFSIFLNIKTGTGWTNISACATSQTAFGLLFPNRTVECSRQLLTYIINIETGGNGCQILFLINFFGRCIFFHKEFNQCFAFCCQDFHQCTLIRQLRNLNITAGSITGPPVKEVQKHDSSHCAQLKLINVIFSRRALYSLSL